MLIVDDHAGFRAQARRTLEAAGFEVVGEAANAEQALAAAEVLLPDIVVLDVQLPDRSGLDIARALGQHAGSVVLVSSREASSYGARITQSGADGFLWKGDLSGAELARVAGIAV